MLGRVSNFRIIFRNVFEHGLPNFLDEYGMCLLEIDYQDDFQQRRNNTYTFDHLLVVIKGQDIVNILEKYFKLLSMMKETILSLPPITYFFYSYLDVDSRETFSISFPSKSVW